MSEMHHRSVGRAERRPQREDALRESDQFSALFATDLERRPSLKATQVATGEKSPLKLVRCLTEPSARRDAAQPLLPIQ